MASLSVCLSKAMSNLTKEDVADVKAAYKDFMDDNYPGGEAAVLAAKAVLEQAISDRDEIVRQITAAGGIAPDMPELLPVVVKSLEAKDEPTAKADPVVGKDVTRGGQLLIGAGDVLKSKSGREMSPAPKVDATSDRKTGNSIRRMDDWLLKEALAEVESMRANAFDGGRGADYLETMLSAIKTSNMSQSDRDTINEVVFGNPDGATVDNLVRRGDSKAKPEPTEKPYELAKDPKTLEDYAKTGEKPSDVDWSFVPNAGWREHLIRARVYAAGLKIDHRGMELPEIVKAIDRKLSEHQGVPEGVTVRLMDYTIDEPEAQIKGGEYKAVAERKSPWAVEDGYGKTPEEARANALQRLLKKVQPQTSLVPEATTKEKIAAEAKAKERKGGNEAMDVGMFGSDKDQTDLVDMAKQESKAGSSADLDAVSSASITEPAEQDKTVAPATGIDAIRDRLLSDEGFKTIVEARKFAKENGVDGTNKEIDEAIENAVVAAARLTISNGGRTGEIYNSLVSLYDRQPNLAVRTSTSVTNQAYSTPMPLAYLASRLAGVQAADLVYEPTAGNGALLIEADVNKVVANEIEPGRARALREQGFATVKSLDATGPDLVRAKSADAVIMNPPFGAVREDGQSKTWTVDGLTTTAIDHAIALNALTGMTDDGKAVLILGGIKAESLDERRAGYRGQSKRKFFAKLYKTYNVTDHFTVSGDLYKKQGAGWPVDVVVIDGRGTSKRPLPAAEPPAIFNSWNELEGKLPNAVSTPSHEKAAVGRGRQDGGAAEAKPESTSGDAGRSETAVRSGTERLPAKSEDDSGRVRGDSDRGKPGDVRESSVNAGADAVVGDRVGGRTDKPAAAKPREPVARKEPPKDSGQALYTPTSNAVSLDTLVPTNMAQATKTALDRVSKKHGDLDKFVAERLGYETDADGMYFLNDGKKERPFSAEQVDALATSIDNIERGAAYVLGWQTGIGKGRVVAGTIRYAIRKGWTPVFVTEKPDLYGDMFRDMTDIGMSKMLGREPRAFMTNTGESVPLDDEALAWKQEADQARADGNPIPKRRGRFLVGGGKAAQESAMRAITSGKPEHDIVFTTYDQMNTIKQQETDRRNFLRAIAPNSLIVMDESHTAGGQGEKLFKKRGVAPDRAEFARDLIKSAAGVMYASATFAKRPDVMDLYARTDMGKAVDDPKMLPILIQRGGIPMQQIVATMLSDAGQMSRLERSFEGVEYNVVPVPVDLKTYGQFSDAVRAVFEFDMQIEEMRSEFMQDILDQMGASQAKDAGVGTASANSTAFASIMHNIVNQMLLSIKADQVATRAIEARKAGEKPVIALASTMESFISDYADDAGVMLNSPIDITFGDVMTKYLDRTLRITIKSAEGEKSHVQIPVKSLPPSLQKKFAEAKALIQNGNFGAMPVSPIDWIRHRVTKAGYSIAEVTGRKSMIDYGAGNMPKYIVRPKSEIGPSGKRSSIAAFNRGSLDVLILNRSGSTGVSMHASSKFKDQSLRHMIIAQAEGNIDTHLQMLGRVHRTGQVRTPRYSQIAAEIPAEARPTAVLMKKMASLNANTTGARSSVFMADSVDFMNEYGDRVVANIVSDEPEINFKLGSPLKENDKGLPTSEDAARRVTGRLVLLSPQDQTDLLNRIQDEYKSEIDRLDALGENALEAKTVDLQARVLDTTPLKDKAGEGPFLDSAQIEKVSVKAQGRAMAPSEVADAVSEFLGVSKPEGNEQASLAALERQGREWINKKVGDVRSRAVSWIAEDVASKSDDARGSTKQRHDEQLRRWIATAQAAAPGSRVTLDLGERQMHGIVLSVARTGKAKNPVALGAWVVNVAVPDSVRTIAFPMSKLYPESFAKSADESGATIKPSMVPISGLISQLTDARREGREERYMVTGNILAGYDQVHGKGQIVNFTMDDGTLRPGILMSRDFALNKFMDTRTVRLRSADQVAEFLEKAPVAEVRTSDKFVTLRLNRGDWIIETAAGRATGGRYYTDSKVRDALRGAEFQRSSGVMRVSLDKAGFKRVVEAIRGLGALFETTEAQDVAQEVVRASMPAQVEPAAPAREVAKPSKDTSAKIAEFGKSVDALKDQLGIKTKKLNLDDDIQYAISGNALATLKDKVLAMKRGSRVQVISEHAAQYAADADLIIDTATDADIDIDDASIDDLKAFLVALADLGQVIEAKTQQGYALSEDVQELRDTLSERMSEYDDRLTDLKDEADAIVDSVSDRLEEIDGRIEDLRVDTPVADEDAGDVLGRILDFVSDEPAIHMPGEYEAGASTLDIVSDEIAFAVTVVSPMQEQLKQLEAKDIDDLDIPQLEALRSEAERLQWTAVRAASWYKMIGETAYAGIDKVYEQIDAIIDDQIVPASDRLEEAASDITAKLDEARERMLDQQEMDAGQTVDLGDVEAGPTFVRERIKAWTEWLKTGKAWVEIVRNGTFDAEWKAAAIARAEPEIARVTENLKQYKEALEAFENESGEKPLFAVGAETSLNIGEELADAIYSGRTYKMPESHVAAQHDAIRPLLRMVPKDTPIGVLEQIEPLGDSIDPLNQNVAAYYRDHEGNSFTIKLPANRLFGIRALVMPAKFVDVGRTVIGLNNILGSKNVGHAAAGEIWHEVIHVLRNGELLKGHSWGRLLAHAAKLRILDRGVRQTLKDFGDSSWVKAPNRTIRETYSTIYANHPKKVEYIRQESVTHMLELWHHGVISDAEMAPVRDILEDIRSGRVSGNSWAVRGSDPVFALARPQPDQDRLGYYSKLLRAAYGLKQEKGTPEQMLAQLRTAGAKEAEIQATGLDRFLSSRTRKPSPAPEGARIREVSVHDAYRGESFGTKAIERDGKIIATADVSITATEANIRNIEVGDRRKGYATALVDDLFREFPDRKITITNMTPDGTKFFRARYDLGKDGRIAPRVSVVTKAEIIKHLEENRVDLREAVYGGRGGRHGYASRDEAALDLSRMIGYDGKTVFVSNPSINGFDIHKASSGRLLGSRPGEMIGQVEKNEKSFYLRSHLVPIKQLQSKSQEASGPAQWPTLSVDPSNPTYRETALHLPDNIAREEEAFVAKFLADKYGETEKTASEAQVDEAYMAAHNSTDLTATNFQSGHFKEPNIIAHARTQILKTSDGRKVFNIDELQSDWAQKIRDGGGRNEAKIAALKQRKQAADEEFMRKAEGLSRELDAMNPEAALGLAPFDVNWRKSSADEVVQARIDRIKEFYSKIERRGKSDEIGAAIGIVGDVQAMSDRLYEVFSPSKMLDAEIRTAEAVATGHPLVNTTDQWTTTSLRRLIRQAVEAGADMISLTPGQVQAERFNIAESVRSLEYDDVAKRLYVEAAGNRYGRTPIAINSADELDSHVGKAVAAKLLEQERGVNGAHGSARKLVFDREQIIGGEGMKATYDVMYPRTLGKLLQKIDPSIKPETVNLRRADGRLIEQSMSPAEAVKQGLDRIPAVDFTAFPITDKVREFVMADGQPLFAIGRYYHSTPAKFDRFQNEYTDEVGFHFGTKNQAHNRAYVMSNGNLWTYFRKWRDIPVDIEIDNPVTLSTDPGSFMPTALAKQLVKDGLASHELIMEVQRVQLGPDGSPDAAKSVVRDYLISKGYDAIRYPNHFEGVGDYSYMTFGTGNVKDARTGDILYAISGNVSDGFKVAGQALRPSIDTKAQADVVQALTDAVEIVRRIAGSGVKVEFRSAIPVGEVLSRTSYQAKEARDRGLLNESAGGFYRPGSLSAEALIGLSTNAPGFDLATAAGHEAWHHVEGVLATPAEKHLLASKSELARMRRLAANELGISVDDPILTSMPDYEVRAYAFQRYRRLREDGAAQASGLHIGVRKFFDHMIQIFRNVQNALRGKGYDSFESIFALARSGEMAKREPDPVTFVSPPSASDDLVSLIRKIMDGVSNDNGDTSAQSAAQVQAFMLQRIGQSDGGALTEDDAIGAYQMWAEDAGIEPMGDQELISHIQRTGISTMRIAGRRQFIGLRLLEENEQRPANPAEIREKDAFELARDAALGFSMKQAISRQIERLKSVIGEKPDFARIADLEAMQQAIANDDSIEQEIYDNVVSMPDDDQIMGALIPRPMPANRTGGVLGRKIRRTLARAGDMSDPARVKLQDKALPIRRIAVEMIENQTGAKVPINLDTYVAEGLYHGRAGERIVDLQDKLIEPFIEHLRASGLTVDEVGDYLYARHAIERNDAIEAIDPATLDGSGMTDSEATSILTAVVQSGKQAEMDKAAGMVDQIILDARDTLLRSGLIDRGTYDAWSNKYKHYAPLRGFELGDDENPDRVRSGRGFDIRGPESRRALGRKSKADNPVMYAILQAQQAIVRAEKNRVNKTLYRMIQANPNPAVWAMYRGESKRRVNPSTGMVETYWVLPPFVRNDAVHGVKINGKQFWMELKHPALARAMRGVGSEIQGTIIGQSLMSLTRTYASLLTSYNPEFMVSNFFRDVETAILNSLSIVGSPKGVRAQIVKDAIALKSIRGAFAALRGDTQGEYAKWFDEYRLAGGKISFMEFNDVERIKKRINSSLKAGKISRALSGAAKYVEDINSAVENGVRLSTYVAMRKAGIEKDRAAFTARELTVNFNRKGEYGPGINAAYLFFNASIQGSTRVAQAFIKSKAVRYAVGGIFATGFALDLFNMIAGGDDDDGENLYDKIPEWIRDRNIIIMNPFGGGDYIMIPMAYGYNTPYLAGQELARLGRGKSGPLEAAARISGATIDAFNPMGTNPLGSSGSFWQFVAPTMLDPGVQVLENKTWYGGPIQPVKFDKNKPDSQNYFTSAPWWWVDTAKVLNSMTGGNEARAGYVDISPEVIEHYAEFAGGGVAKFLANAFNSGSRVVNGEEWLPEKTPFIRRLYGKATAQSRAREFYDIWDDVDRAHYEVKELTEKHDKPGADAARTKYAPELRVYSAMKGAKNTLKNLRKQRDKIKADDNLDRTTRQQRLDDIDTREKDLIARVLKQYRDVQKARNPVSAANQADNNNDGDE